MKLLLVAATVAVSLALSAGASSAQTPQMLPPGPEHKALARWVGTWTMEGTMKPSPMGPGGQVTSTEHCRMFEGGLHLVCDSEGTGPFGPMKGHAILTWDRAAGQYRYFAINNLADAELAAGTRSGDTWTWTSTTEVDGQPVHSRFVVTETSSGTDSMKWEISMDGKSWQPIMEGTSRKNEVNERGLRGAGGLDDRRACQDASSFAHPVAC
jgi:hypothetical protein